ncbi:MAG: CBS domain-containing protein [Thermoproteus sp. AZ2]|uniref:CBS domain-containing protein n=1 Tax=Thermoproteus sp. AZ2 TaxID=1609232 RepID=A0ACC6V0T8_9CREN
MLTKEIMGGRVVSCTTRDTIRCAVSKMYAYNVGSVVVVDDLGSPVGIFTERDLVRAVAEGLSLDTPLERVAKKELVVASLDEPLISVANKMIEHNIRHIPVVEGGKVVGVLSIRDALRSLVALEATYP